MDLDADFLDDALFPAATKTVRTAGKFQPKACPKKVKSALTHTVVPGATQSVPPPTLEPPVNSSNPKCLEDESSLPTSQGPVTHPEASHPESLIPSSNDEVVFSPSNREGEVANTAFDSEPFDLIQHPSTGTMDLDADFLDDVLFPVATKTVRTAGKFQPKACPKTVKSALAHTVVPGATQSVPPTLEPPVHSSNPKCLEDESSLPTSLGPVSELEASHPESLVPSSNDEPVFSLSDRKGEVANMAFDSEPFDLIQHPSTARTVGRFKPKTKGQSKDEKLITISTAVPGSEDCMEPDLLEVSQSGVAFNGNNKDVSHYDQEESQTICSPVLESIPDDKQPALTAGDHESFGISIVNSSGLASMPILFEPHVNKIPDKVNSDQITSVEDSQNGLQVSESDVNLHSQLDEPGVEAMDLLSDVSPFGDALFQPSNIAVKKAGKFQPKLIPRPKVIKDNRVSSKAPHMAETVAPPVDSLAPSQNEGNEVLAHNFIGEEPSFLQMLGEGSSNEAPDSLYTMSGYNNDIHMNHEKSGHEDTSPLLGLESFENILSQPIPTTACAGELQHNLGVKVKNIQPGVPVNIHGVSDSLHSQRDSVSMDPESLVCHTPVSPSCINSLTIGTCYSMPTDSAHELEYHNDTSILEVTPGKDDPIIGEEETSAVSKDINKDVQSHDAEVTQESLDGKISSKTVEAVGTRKSLRKIKKGVNVTNACDGRTNNELGFDNTNISEIDEVHNNAEYQGEEEPKKKRMPRKPKRQMTENEKPVRKRKKASEEPSLTMQEPVKKKFPHTTRRKRRQVNKVLLEAPEDEIDPRQLSIKDLIMLAEAKEKISNKEAAALKKTTPSESIFSENTHFAKDNYFGTDEQHLNLDGDEANNNIHTSSTKLNYHSFMRRSSTRWSKSETELLYQAIRQFGTDFAMIQKLLPNKTRHQIKLKFKNEERKHPLEVADALIHRTKDHSQFELVIEQLRKEAEEKARNEAFDDPDAIFQDMVPENEEEIAQPYRDKEEVDDWNDVPQPSDKFDEYGDYYGWDANASSPQDMEKDSYNNF